MGKALLSVGLDVGTSTTQVLVSRLYTENRASAFGVPDYRITERQVVYESPVYLTPLLQEQRVDGDAIRTIVEEEYRRAGITPEQVDTGAVIITGETSRKENARAVAESLAELAGDFVVATAGPDLESALAARGAGAVLWSEQTGKTVLHMDIGGGTSNLALIQKGKIVRTGCLNVGGRLVKTDETGAVTYISPVLSGLTHLKIGDRPGQQGLMELAELLAQALQMAAGLQKATELLGKLTTEENAGVWQCDAGAVLSFSGGVAACMETPAPSGAFGDLGPELAGAILKSALCQGEYRVCPEPIRATVIGAGCHSATLSGSTVYYQNVTLPLKNLPVIMLDAREQMLPQVIGEKIRTRQEESPVLFLPGFAAPVYSQIDCLARGLREALGDKPAYVCVEGDMAKALGQRLSLLTDPGRPILCLDRLQLQEGSFLDVGEPVGPALPVIIKTLVLRGNV